MKGIITNERKTSISIKGLKYHLQNYSKVVKREQEREREREKEIETERERERD